MINSAIKGLHCSWTPYITQHIMILFHPICEALITLSKQMLAQNVNASGLEYTKHHDVFYIDTPSVIMYFLSFFLLRHYVQHDEQKKWCQWRLLLILINYTSFEIRAWIRNYNHENREIKLPMYALSSVSKGAIGGCKLSSEIHVNKSLP